MFDEIDNINPYYASVPIHSVNKIFSKKVPRHTVPKNDLYIFLPYLGKLSLSARSTLEKTIHDILPCVNLKVVFRIKNRLSSKFFFKDKISKEMRSLLCYKFQCSSCNATYYVKPNVTLRFVSLKIWESLHVRVKTTSLPKILLCVIIF